MLWNESPSLDNDTRLWHTAYFTRRDVETERGSHQLVFPFARQGSLSFWAVIRRAIAPTLMSKLQVPSYLPQSSKIHPLLTPSPPHPPKDKILWLNDHQD